MPSFNFESIDVPAAAGTYSYIGVTGVDAAGDAVGYYGYVDGDDDAYWHGFIAATPNGATFDPPGSTSTDVNGVTPGGEIFGDYTYLNKEHGYVDNNGVVTTIDILLANSTTVTGITVSGEIYGNFAGNNAVSGFIDNNGNYSVVQVAGAAATTVAAINAAGEIVGTYSDSSYISHGFARVGGVTTTINAPNAYSTSVVGVSGNGTVVGNFQDLSNNQHAFIDSNGVVTQFDIAGSTETQINAITDSGEIGGWYLDVSGHVHGFTDQGGTITTVDVPGSTQTNITGVNSNGEIFGYYEDASFQQHGFVGNPVPTVIEALGSTSLVQAGNVYDLNPVAGGTGPTMKYQGSAITVDEFAGWSPIGAEATSTGYDAAWKLAGADQYTVWATDANGNDTVQLLNSVSGSSAALEALETTFHQDLNGDGVIGIPSTTIESFGSTSLVQSGNVYDLDPVAGGTGPTLKYQGSAITVGEFAGWSPIGADATSTGYDAAWKLAGADEYTVWATDANGNDTVKLVDSVSGSSAALETQETTFHQDLNGDGVIGIPSTTIESQGSTSLVQSANVYDLDPVAGGTGPTLKYQGSAITVGEFPGWSPIGAEATSTGYDAAWKLAGADEYTVWATDTNGNDTVKLVDSVPGSSTALEALETSFHQDLNGDGVIGAAATINSGAMLEISAASSVSITFGGATGKLTLDHSTTFTGEIIGLTGTGSPASSDQIDLKDIAFGAGTTESFSGNSAGGTLTVSDAAHDTASIALVGNYTASTFTLSNDGSGGTLVIDPPKTASGNAATGGQPQPDSFNFNSSSTPQTAAQSPSVTVGGSASDHFVFQPGNGVDHSGNALAFTDLSSAPANEHFAAILHDAQPLFGGANGDPGFVDFGDHNSLTAHLTDLSSHNFFH
ncbi:hypothetical protein [Bradyrhizobium sp. LTSPM299]|uniref:hypothetical protein n=1 Tax=Bradyrhizobium sp. LTSPM299 TaxID=1619233 RepID=UPI00067862D4|nr:hypothetical protein [Bradyrhizobium sp. LTSPM299]